MLNFIQHIEDVFETGEVTGLVLVDLSAAYNTINRRRLLENVYMTRDYRLVCTVVCMGRRTSPKCTTLKDRDYDVTPYIIAHLYPQMHQGSVKDCDV